MATDEPCTMTLRLDMASHCSVSKQVDVAHIPKPPIISTDGFLSAMTNEGQRDVQIPEVPVFVAIYRKLYKVQLRAQGHPTPEYDPKNVGGR